MRYQDVGFCHAGASVRFEGRSLVLTGIKKPRNGTHKDIICPKQEHLREPLGVFRRWSPDRPNREQARHSHGCFKEYLCAGEIISKGFLDGMYISE